jgi:hypothetical protein
MCFAPLSLRFSLKHPSQEHNMRLQKKYLCLALWIGSSSLLVAQSHHPSKAQLSMSSGTTWAMQAMQALTSGVQVNSVTESGSVTWNIGQNQGTGDITMQSSGNTSSEIQLSTSAGNRTETRSWASDGSGPVGQWTDLNGQPHQMAQHNCWTDAVWFFPALSMLSNYSDPTMVYNDLGPEQYNGHNVEHIQAYRALPPGSPSDLLARLSTVNYYLDSDTAIPLAMRFAVHDDHNLNLDVPVELVFSQYQAVDGILSPFEVTRMHNGSPLYQITVSSVGVNGQNLPVHPR